MTLSISPPALLGSDTLYQTGTQARSTYIHLLRTAHGLDPYGFYVRFPHFVGPSMGMAHSVAEVSGLTADRTFCHDFAPPLTVLGSLLDVLPKIHNKNILAENPEKSKGNLKIYFFFTQNSVYLFL